MANLKHFMIAILLFASSAFAQEQAKSAYAFVDSIGVNVQMNTTNSLYTTDLQTTEYSLTQLGVRHVKDSLPVTFNSTFADNMQVIGSNGIQVDLVIPYQSSTTAATILKYCNITNNCEALEYPAVDSSTTTSATWLGELKTLQPILKQAAASLNVPINGPAFNTLTSYTTAANQLSGYYTNSSVLLNLGQTAPEAYPIAAALQSAALPDPTITSTFVTWGYYNVIGCNTKVVNSATVCDPKTYYKPLTLNSVNAGAYFLRMAATLFSLGVQRSYIYQLIDAPGSTNSGLVFNTGFSKRSWNDLHNLISIVNSKPTSLDSLTYTLTGASVNHLLLEGANKTFYLLLWQPVSNINATTGAPVAVTPVPVTIGLPNNKIVKTWQFQIGNDPITTTAPTSNVVNVIDTMTVVEIQ